MLRLNYFMFTMKKLGYSSYWMEVNSNGGTALTDSLLGNRYHIVLNTDVTDEQEIIYQNSKYSIVKNELPSTFGSVFTAEDMEGYAQFEYISDEMKDFFAMADLIISRAGANSICEIAALNKPNILIPLSARASRGDQILNAKSYKKQGFSEVIDEDTATAEDLVNTVNSVYENRSKYIDAMKKSAGTGGVDMIVDLINSLVK